MFNRTKHVLMAAAGDGGGGGGAGDGKGGDGKGGGEAEIPDHIKTFVEGAVTRGINGALGTWGKRFEAKIPTADSLKETISTSLAEALKGLKPDGAGGDGGGDDGGGDGKRKRSADDPMERKFLKLQDDLKKTQDALKAKDEQATKEREERARAEERTELGNALRKVGVPDARAAAAAALLFHERKLVARNEAGEICLKVKSTVGGQTMEDLVPLSEGVEAWAKTPEGKEFMPPVDAGGSGNRGGRVPGPRPGEKMSREQAGSVLTSWIME